MESKLNLNQWDSRDYDIYERKEFWNAMRPWLAGKGYILYQYIHCEPTPWDPKGTPRREAPCTIYKGFQELPYALLDTSGSLEYKYRGNTVADSPHWNFETTCQHRFMHAQDSQGRHVIVKAVNGNSDEIKILQRLKDNIPLSRDPTDFTGVIPVLDILPYEDNFFVIMPRWGDPLKWDTWFNHNYEVLDFIHYILKGLVVLHDNRIFHLDLREGNILVSYAWGGECPSDPELLQELRKDQKLVYAINDFDLSYIFPMDTPLKTFRLHASAANSGVPEQPYGVLSGELDFNPFAYDVGCLGIYFCENYQHLTSDLPFLAPLLDGMVTANIEKRLTAKEALDFFEDECANLTNEQLQRTPSEPAVYPDLIAWDCYDRWYPLAPGLKTKWARYRMQKPSWLARQLQSLRSKSLCGAYTVHYFRLFGRYLKTPLMWIVYLVYRK